MTRVDILFPYVEKVLRDFSGKKDIGPDESDRYSLALGSARYYVILAVMTPGEQPIVQVWSVVLANIDKSPELLEELNDINGSIHFARVYWIENQVWAVTEILASDLDAGELTNACTTIGSITDTYDNELKKKFGGEMMGKDPLFG